MGIRLSDSGFCALCFGVWAVRLAAGISSLGPGFRIEVLG